MITDADLPLRHYIYRYFSENGSAPTITVLAHGMNQSKEDIIAGLQRLHRGHALHLAPDGRTILMANPFSGITTDCLVYSGKYQWRANCIWDAFGILVCTRRDGQIQTRCPQSGATLNVDYRDGKTRGDRGIVHFDRPFRRWYDNLVET